MAREYSVPRLPGSTIGDPDSSAGRRIAPTARDSVDIGLR